MKFRPVITKKSVKFYFKSFQDKDDENFVSGRNSVNHQPYSTEEIEAKDYIDSFKGSRPKSLLRRVTTQMLKLEELSLTKLVQELAKGWF